MRNSKLKKLKFVSPVLLFILISSTLCGGDMFWSPLTGLDGVNDFAVTGTTIYAATETGLYRSQGDPESWELLRPGCISLVACSGDRVIWEESDVVSTVYVTDNALGTINVVNGLDDAISRGIRDLAIADNTALVATLWGVDRSVDGGYNFPSAFPVLWESSGEYQITAVWTNGVACVAAGSGGSQAQGIWYSPSGSAGTWTLVESTGGQSWLNGSDENTLVSGNLYGGASDPGFISTDAGANWNPLPMNWGTVSGHYQRPFISESRILTRHVYDVFDPGSGQFITYTDGPLLYDNATGIGNDLDPSLAFEGEILNQAIVEGLDPFLLIAERSGQVYWFRVTNGWPAQGFDFTPPFSPSLSVSPKIATVPTASVVLQPTAGDADTMYLAEDTYSLWVSYDVNGFTSTLTHVEGPTSDGWISYNHTLP